MRIVHFSDLHIGCMPRSISGFGGKRVLGILNYVIRRWHQVRGEFLRRAITEIHRLRPEWVVCSGDLTNVGNPEEFERALRLLQPIRDAYRDRFIYVPGNHDAYVDSPASRQALAEAFQELNNGRWHLEELPLHFVTGGLPIILLNEALPTSCLSSTGVLSPTACARLTEYVADQDSETMKPLLIGHFPARDSHGQRLSARRRLTGDDRLARWLQEGRISAHMCGHIHRPFLREEPGGGLEICAGSLTMSGYLSVLDYLPDRRRFRHFWVDLSTAESFPAPVGSEVPAPG